jgi:tripeptidyl-peptidase-1
VDPSIYDGFSGAAASYDAASRDLDYRYGIYYSRKHTAKLNIVWRVSPGHVLSFNEWLDAVDGSYCTSDGGDDYAYDPPFPNLPIGDPQEHSCGTISPPHVISNSRADFEYRLSPFYTQRQCNEFAKLGLMGVSVLFSAGNFGAAGTTQGYCLDDNGT